MVYKLEIKENGGANLYKENVLVRENIPPYEVESFITPD